MRIILFLLLLITVPVSAETQDPSELSMPLSSSPPSSAPTSLATSSSRPTLQETQNPTTTPSKTSASKATNKPTDYGVDDPLSTWCDENPDFFVEFLEYDHNCSQSSVKLTCGDYRVACPDPYSYVQNGNLGDANDYCCKCKVECLVTGHCGHFDTTPPPYDYSSGCEGVYDSALEDNDENDSIRGLPPVVIVFCVLIVLAICTQIITALMLSEHQRKNEEEDQRERKNSGRIYDA